MITTSQMPQDASYFNVENVDLWVSSGNHLNPFYRFYKDSLGTNQINDLLLETNKTYTFRRLDSASSHPFYVSDSGYNQPHTAAISISGDGSAGRGITGDQSFTLSFNDVGDIGQLSYYCTAHSNMFANFKLSDFASRIFTDIDVVTYDPLSMNLLDFFHGLGIQDVSDQKAILSVPGWRRELPINRVINSNESSMIARQLEFLSGTLPQAQDVKVETSFLNGGLSSQTLRGLAGWDVIDAGDGDDRIRGGNGRDILTGGKGADEIWGDFGLNSYLGNEDGFKDLLVIKSDQLLENWWYGKSGNNPNGEKADIISELDNFDQIKILGAASEDLSVSSVSIHNLSGLGIYASGFLEAVYIGTNFSAEQLSTMMSGDASPAVMNNSQDFYGL